MIAHNIKGVMSALQADSTLRAKLDFLQEVDSWKSKALTAFLDCKRRSWRTALKNFIRDNDVAEYLIHCPDQTMNHKDDSIRILYTIKECP